MFQHGVAINLIPSLTSVGFELSLSYYSTSLYTGNSIVKFSSKAPNALRCNIISQLRLRFKPWGSKSLIENVHRLLALATN